MSPETTDCRRLDRASDVTDKSDLIYEMSSTGLKYYQGRNQRNERATKIPQWYSLSILSAYHSMNKSKYVLSTCCGLNTLGNPGDRRVRRRLAKACAPHLCATPTLQSTQLGTCLRGRIQQQITMPLQTGQHECRKKHGTWAHNTEKPFLKSFLRK